MRQHVQCGSIALALGAVDHVGITVGEYEFRLGFRSLGERRCRDQLLNVPTCGLEPVTGVAHSLCDFRFGS